MRALGHLRPRSTGGGLAGAGGLAGVGVVVFHSGKWMRLPGGFAYSCPVGEVQMTVPSDSCRSVHPLLPVQKVLSR